MREPAGLQQKHIGAIIIAVAAFVAALILLIVLLVGPTSDVGTVVITSTPTAEVRLFLDGNEIGNRTPLTRNDIPTGEHVLFARAAGYADRAYKFELVAGAPAVINIDLAPTAVAAPVADGTIVVVSEPAGATVRIGGVSLGETPKTLTGQDPTKPVIIEVLKEGYHPATQSVTFAPNTKDAELRLVLKPLGGTRPALSGGRGAVRFETKPGGAMVYVDKRKVCMTPCEARDLDVSVSHEFELVKEGHKTERDKVSFKAGETTVLVSRKLDEAERRQPAQRPDPPPKPQPQPQAAGGGKCGGSGAKLSVMTLGESDCKVSVGKTDIGVAPFLNKDVPTGKCDVKVVCPSGKKLTKTLILKSGGAEKLKIDKDQWQ